MQALPEWVIKVLHEWAEHKNSHWNTASSFDRGGRIETFRLVLSVHCRKRSWLSWQRERQGFAHPSTATVETGAHIQQITIPCTQASHAVENIQQRKESKWIACIENLPDDILVCGVVQKILVQLEGRHLFCRQQSWLGKEKSKLTLFSNHNGSLLRQQPGARDMAWLDAHTIWCRHQELWSKAAWTFMKLPKTLLLCQIDGNRSPSLSCSGHKVVQFGQTTSMHTVHWAP